MAVNYKNRVVVNCATGKKEEIPYTKEEIDARIASDEAYAKVGPDRSWSDIRQERNSRLAATDYFSLSDVTMSDDMKSYRQALRDLPANISDSVAFQTQWNDFIDGKDGVSDPWPTKPS